MKVLRVIEEDDLERCIVYIQASGRCPECLSLVFINQDISYDLMRDQPDFCLVVRKDLIKSLTAQDRCPHCTKKIEDIAPRID